MSNGGGEPLFLTKGQVLAYHHQQIELFGGAHGIIDEGLLDSALNQPLTTWCYNPAADLFDLAATYAFHLSKNHAFRDGNERVGLQAALAFLRFNGVKVVTTEEQMFEAMSRLVTDAIDKPQFAAFFRQHRQSAD
jgi:death-on-curing protein